MQWMHHFLHSSFITCWLCWSQKPLFWYICMYFFSFHTDNMRLWSRQSRLFDAAPSCSVFLVALDEGPRAAGMVEKHHCSTALLFDNRLLVQRWTQFGSSSRWMYLPVQPPAGGFSSLRPRPRHWNSIVLCIKGNPPSKLEEMKL